MSELDQLIREINLNNSKSMETMNKIKLLQDELSKLLREAATLDEAYFKAVDEAQNAE